ncbi:putative disease resistance RPP13-like protein 1 [Ananas comosus]|uniref:Putative disease resistance RPP13-like protein 1 n=1 Tax=Ananas comosus TaxID=4615 RepID=A0A199W8L7_ANACO|nr:putative disease resistance RPP13-like protein 1 [Ananas comosus]
MGSPQKIKLKRRLNKLEKIAGEAQTLRDLLGATAAPDRQNIAQPPQKVFGRDKDREEIIRRLKTEPAAICEPGSSSGIPIIAIVGRPGVGKTALAQYICEQLRSELGDGHFDLIMWVYASCDFNASEIMKNIIQQASIASESQDSVNPDDLAVTILALLRNRNTNLDTMVVGNLDSPEGLRLKMNKMLNAKNFLLVIDDVWCDGEDHKKNWKTLRCLSNCCLPGSKILVTSQMEDAPRKIGAAIGATIEHIFPLKDIEENYFSDLFIHHALPSGEIDSHLREELEEKCRTIARKLNKDPTAAEMVGETIATEMARLLRSQALMWSYRHLPAHLQRHTFEALQLVQLWMAQGFIKPDDQNKRMEDSVCTLYQLQANSDLISGIPDIGKLTFLQGLKHFQVKKEKGYELEQLQNLNELRGHLCIDNLENVESKDSAIAAKLKEKEHLDMLQLVWCGGLDNVNSSSDVEILEGLQLPPYLTSLILDGYRGRSCPSAPTNDGPDLSILQIT